MTSSENAVSTFAPAGWGDVLVRALKVAVVAFLVFHVKEYVDAGRVDSWEIAIDAGWIAGGALVLESILNLIRGSK